MKRIIITIILLSIIITVYPCTKKYTGLKKIIHAYNNQGTDYVTQRHVIMTDDLDYKIVKDGIIIKGVHYSYYWIDEKQGVTIVCCEKCNCFNQKGI